MRIYIRLLNDVNKEFALVTISLFLIMSYCCSVFLGGANMDIEFGNKLKTLREERAWSQDDLAKEINVSRQAVYKWEANKGYPDIHNLIRISDIFNVTIDDLIRSDKDLQDKISIDEEENFDQFSDPGFYIGIMLVFLSIYISNDSLSNMFMIIGVLTVLFLTDTIKSIKSLF